MADMGRESVWFATALELIRGACEANCSALACAGRMAVKVRRAITAEQSL